MKTTTENNRIIAEFMGWKEQTDPTERWFGSFREPNGILHKNTNTEPLLFHSSWDWLMPVVEKIEGLENSIYQVDIMQEGARILKRCKHFDKPIDCTVSKMPEGTTKLEATYKAVVQFIKWYNENK